MDITTLWKNLDELNDALGISSHPLHEMIREGTATLEHIKGFAIQHYEMTIRDSGPYMAQGYINMSKLDSAGADLLAENFAEEAMGLFSNTIGHREQLHEFWAALGLPESELIEAIASPEARAFNAFFWALMTQKIRYSGALGLLEGEFVTAAENMYRGLQEHYGMTSEQLRFFSTHIEADREHAETGKKLIERLLPEPLHRANFLNEARCGVELYRRAWDTMMPA